MKREITTRTDIERLVNHFYDKVKQNKVIGPIFTDVAHLDWNAHLPIMYAFWESMLLGGRSYSGNPMQKHTELSRKTPLGEKEFAEWLNLFHETVDELFVGSKAIEAKKRAAHIAGIMHHKVQST